VTAQPVLLEKTRSEECGCPEERWLVGGIETTIHEEGDGTVHCILDDGNAQAEMTFRFASLEEARDPVLGWARAMLFATHGWG
jgi:hypothetical protein